MLTPNRIYAIFIFFMVMCCVSQSFRLQTEESLTAVRGRNISIPCNFSVPVVAVYWYKHNFTGAPDDGASLVARDFQGITDPVPGFDRFSITRDYSLIIRNITVHDETTFSCLVVPRAIADERGYTELRVVALADPREPIIQSCSVTAPGRCIYTVDENSPEHVTLSCAVSIVRPPPKLTWIRSDGRVLENTTHQMQEKNGLFNISSQIQVSKADLYKQYTCLADGEAVDGTSSMTSTIEDDVITVYHDRVINGGLITSIVINVILLIILIIMVSYHYLGNNKKYGFAGPSGTVKLSKPEPPDIIQSQLLAEQEAVNFPESRPLDIFESQPSTEQEAVNLPEPEPRDHLEAQPFMEQEAVNLQEPEPRDHLEVQPLMEQEVVNLPEPEPRDHLEAQPLMEQEAVKIQKPEPLGDIESQPLMDQEEQTATKLSQKIESLENQRKEDRASFEEEKREIESNWQKILHDQVEKLKTQELTVTKLSQKNESLENERKEDRASFEEEKRVIESNWQKTVNDQVEKLMKTQELTVTKLSQKIESLENERKEDRASFEEEKRVIESNWQKTVNYQVEELMKTQERLMIKLSRKIAALENERKEDRTSFEEEKREMESIWKILHHQVDKQKTQELTETELKEKTEAYKNEKRRNRAALVKERLNTQGNELRMITLTILYHDSGYMEKRHVEVNQHMQLEELKGKLCETFEIHQSLIHFTHEGQDLSRGGREDLKTVGLDDSSVLNVSKINPSIKVPQLKFEC